MNGKKPEKPFVIELMSEGSVTKTIKTKAPSRYAAKRKGQLFVKMSSTLDDCVVREGH